MAAQFAGGADKPWNVLLAGVDSVARVEGGAAAEHAHGILVRAEGPQIAIYLEDR
ncbi:hypothetical protein [Actinomadura keratinilytica]|uniref:hypothetical protein n=1 Tax=Actinomadura keratinilytica TaxID=547461 RepID=UPI00361C92DD